MKSLLRLLVIIAILGPLSALAADAQIALGDPKTQSLRQFYVTGSGAVSASLTVPTQGTNLFELVSIDAHLSAAGAAANLTVTKNSGLGAVYDTVLLTQDMTSVTDLLILYEPGEAIFSNLDSIDVAWANGSSRTYGLTIKYRVK